MRATDSIDADDASLPSVYELDLLDWRRRVSELYADVRAATGWMCVEAGERWA